MAVWRAKMKTSRMVDPGLVLARLQYAKGAATLVAQDPRGRYCGSLPM
jgi:hypothetical protein